jgi:hypothetical protein
MYTVFRPGSSAYNNLARCIPKLSQHSNRLSEFIQQGGRIDACGSDALTSIAGGYQGGSFGVVHR